MQLELLADVPRKLARRSDPSTSHAAAAKVAEFAGSHRAVIVAALAKHGPMTVDQIAARTKLQSQQINKRLPDLQRDGKAAPTGEERPSASGHMERVWRAVR